MHLILGGVLSKSDNSETQRELSRDMLETVVHRLWESGELQEGRIENIRALIDNEPFKGDIWECACGNGAMSNVLEETGCHVPSSDLYDRGYGDAGVDFLDGGKRADNIVTNPPYKRRAGPGNARREGGEPCEI